MDVNGTRFHLLLNEDDWSACHDGRVALRPPGDPSEPEESVAPAAASVAPGDEQLPDVVWNRERSELTLRPLLFQFVTPPKDTPPSLHLRRGAARDRSGNWYWIDGTARRIQVLRAETQTVETFWPPPVELPDETLAPPGDFRPREVQTPALLRFLGLTITDGQYLIVGVLEPAGLLVFDLYSANTPLQILWPAGIAFSPFDMAAAPGGGVFVLDRQNRCYWTLDRHFNVIAQPTTETPAGADDGREDFQTRGASDEQLRERRTRHVVGSLDASPITIDDPIAIEALPDGTVLILDSNPARNFSRIYRYRFQSQLGEPLSTDRMKRLMQRDVKTGFRLSGFDFAFVPQHNAEGTPVAPRLYVAADDGNQVFAFALTMDEERFELEPLPDYLPMRMFGSKGLVAVGAELFYDFRDGWIPLVEQRRPRYLSAATLYTPLSPADGSAADLLDNAGAFDGREPDCVWHRLMLDACIPPETEVRISSRAANEERELALAAWQTEPALYLRAGGTELPFLLRRQTNTAAAGDGTWELLFQKARGRYLQLRLELYGNGRTTPRLRALRAYYPRFSYLEHYLPAVYREDAASASFLDRFLSNIEGLFTALEDRVAAAQLLFDVRGAPAESLEWLAGWLGVALDPTWDENRRRLFIKYAPAFFRHRGTAQGLQMALRLALDECPTAEIFNDEPTTTKARPGGIRIVEKYATRQPTMIGASDASETAADPAQPRLVARTARWRPEQGRAVLHERFTDFLRSQNKSPAQLVEYTITESSAWPTEWAQFSRETLGFVPTATGVEARLWQDFLKRRYFNIEQLRQTYKAKWSSFAQVPLPGDMPLTNPRLSDWLQFLAETAPAAGADGRRRWQGFLARRYQSVAKFNAAYGTRWAAFEVASLPEGLPPDGAPLLDWYQFEGIALPMHEGAHRFSVLLPMHTSAAFDSEEEQRRHAFARRIVNLEKPAHTIFEMKFYWELFRVGEARLGADTLIDLGSRAPQLMSALVLGRGHLAETYVPARQQIPDDRAVLGREQLKK